MKTKLTLPERFAQAHQKLTTVAVTGTNGKTSTTTMLARIVSMQGRSAYVTTLGAVVDGERVEGSGTQEFLGAVERSVERGVKVVAVEMTSKALAAGLAQRWRPQVAAFTNLSHDHLDMHDSPESYLAAKAQLFMALPPGGVAVLNRRDPACALIAEVIPAHAQVRWYEGLTTSVVAGELAEADVELAAASVRHHAGGQEITLAPSPLAETLGGTLRLQLAGMFQVDNALAAALAADSLGLQADAIANGLAALESVPGRFQIVLDRPLSIVDYAHTPDALRQVLRSARSLCDGRLICVFGCGGQRDRSKRAPMGALVDALADVAILTSDNPRQEDPADIASEVKRGARDHGLCARWHEESDRRQAIAYALSIADDADVVVVAGKGHESTQTIGQQEHAFDDVAVLRALRPSVEAASQE